jgi:hypothetical protein
MEPGQRVIAHVDDGRLVIERRDAILERLRRELSGSARTGAGMVEELIAERREDARREAEDAER